MTTKSDSKKRPPTKKKNPQKKSKVRQQSGAKNTPHHDRLEGPDTQKRGKSDKQRKNLSSSRKGKPFSTGST